MYIFLVHAAFLVSTPLKPLFYYPALNNFLEMSARYGHFEAGLKGAKP